MNDELWAHRRQVLDASFSAVMSSPDEHNPDQVSKLLLYGLDHGGLCETLFEEVKSDCRAE